MSLFSALTVAVNGLNAQSQAMGNISDNLSNSNTIGYKRIDTRFESLVTQSSSSFNDPGGVKASPVYQNDIQGNLQSSQVATSLSINGDGFFAVQRASTDAAGSTLFTQQDFYTRRGDFTLNKNGYLVNGAGYYLLGYNVDQTTGQPDTAQVNPIRISALLDNPVATSGVAYSANLPAGATAGNTYPSSTIQVYDALGATHALSITWTKSAGTNQWAAKIASADGLDPLSRTLNFEFSGTTAGTIGSLSATKTVDSTSITSLAVNAGAKTLTLGSSDWATQGYEVGDTVTVGGTASNNATYTIASISGAVATIVETPTTEAANAAATITRAAPGISQSTAPGQTGPAITIIPPVAPDTAAKISFEIEYPGAGKQTVTMNLGDYNVATGLTQFGDTTLQVASFEQNGIPRGSFESLAVSDSGLVTLNYDNGRSRTLFQIPLAQFYSPNNLQRVDGGAYTRTLESGTPRFSAAKTVGAGAIVSNSLEGSNVDIADEFTKMIQAQRVYSANARTISTTSSMLEEITNLIR